MEPDGTKILAKTRGSNMFVKWLLDQGLEEKASMFNELRGSSLGAELYDKTENEFYSLSEFKCIKCKSNNLRLDYKIEVDEEGREYIGACAIFCKDCRARFRAKDIDEKLDFGLIGSNDRGMYTIDFYLLASHQKLYQTRNFYFGMLSTTEPLPLEYLHKEGLLDKKDFGSFSGGNWSYAYVLTKKGEKKRDEIVRSYLERGFGFELAMYLGQRWGRIRKLAEEISFEVRRITEKEEEEFRSRVLHLPERSLEQVLREDQEELPL